MPAAPQGPLPARPAMPCHAASDKQARAALSSYCHSPASEPAGMSRTGTGRPPGLGVIHSGFVAPLDPAGSGSLAPLDPAGSSSLAPLDTAGLCSDPPARRGKHASFCYDYADGSYPPCAPSLSSSSSQVSPATPAALGGSASGSGSGSRFPSPLAGPAGGLHPRPTSSSRPGPGLGGAAVRSLRRSLTALSLTCDDLSSAASADVAVAPVSPARLCSGGGSTGGRRSLVPHGGLSQTSSLRRRESCFG